MLKRWVAGGAEHDGHWSNTPPKKVAVFSRANSVDDLVAKKLKELRLKPSRETERWVRARRLHFDLIGLPPKPGKVAAFQHDNSPCTYERLVGRLMASQNFGERMAIGWLEVVRFADTIGYHSDNTRNIWPYRDYVIRSLNQNTPFYRFTQCPRSKNCLLILWKSLKIPLRCL